MLKRSFSLQGHRTSIALEEAFWTALENIARSRNITLPQLISEIDRKRLAQEPPAGLASSLRVFALADAQAQNAQSNIED